MHSAARVPWRHKEKNYCCGADSVLWGPLHRSACLLQRGAGGEDLHGARLRLLLLVHEHGEEDPVVLLEGIDVVLM